VRGRVAEPDALAHHSGGELECHWHSPRQCASGQR
jgi:hypothetical protein